LTGELKVGAADRFFFDGDHWQLAIGSWLLAKGQWPTANGITCTSRNCGRLGYP
jgi:hypothetical protein